MGDCMIGLRVGGLGFRVQVSGSGLGFEVGDLV